MRRSLWQIGLALTILVVTSSGLTWSAPLYSEAADTPATATALVKMREQIEATLTASAKLQTTATSTPIGATGAPRVRSTPQPPPTGGASADPVLEVLVQGLNLRSGPGVSYAIVGNATRGQLLPVLGQTSGCAWIKVSMGEGKDAWTSGAAIYSRLNVPCGRVAAAAVPTPQPLTQKNDAATAAAGKKQTVVSQPAGAAQGVNVPVLIFPENDSHHWNTRITFAWTWQGDLQPNWGFDIRGWRGDGAHNSIVDAQATANLHPDKDGMYALEVGVPPAFSATDWFWSVAVVRLDPFESLSPEALPNLIHVDTRTPTPRPEINDGGDSGGIKDPPTSGGQPGDDGTMPGEEDQSRSDETPPSGDEQPGTDEPPVEAVP